MEENQNEPAGYAEQFNAMAVTLRQEGSEEV